MSFVIALILWAAIHGFYFSGRARRKRLSSLLADTVLVGIISHEQKQAIEDFANKEKQALSRIRGTTWLAIFAGLFVVAGICLMIAANWKAIGAEVRIVFFVTVFGIVAEIAIRFQNRQTITHIVSSLIWYFLPILGIALYGQTFQIESDPIRPFLVWLVLVTPLVWLIEIKFLRIFHMLAFVAIVFSGNFIESYDLYLFSSSLRWLPWLLTLVIFAYLIAHNQRFIKSEYRSHLINFYWAWCFALLFSKPPFELYGDLQQLMAVLVFGTALLPLHLFLNSNRQDCMFGFVVWAASCYGLTFIEPVLNNHLMSNQQGYVGVGIVLAVFLLTILMLLRLPNERLTWYRTISLVGKGVIILPVLIGLLHYIVNRDSILPQLLANLVLLTAATLLVWHGVIVEKMQQINIGVALLMIVLVTRLFDIFHSLMTSGVGLMATGIGLALFTHLINKAKKRLIMNYHQGSQE